MKEEHGAAPAGAAVKKLRRGRAHTASVKSERSENSEAVPSAEVPGSASGTAPAIVGVASDAPGAAPASPPLLASASKQGQWPVPVAKAAAQGAAAPCLGAVMPLSMDEEEDMMLHQLELQSD